ncbi:C39 family peptidase [Mycolicibacterium sp. Dal123E01]|uniref:C39 family peptidase n=1 Tax=Mycolicibacterium sp. Dal123E01 TaxID=3457578 RepID=UPI00403EE4A3
MSSSQAAPAPAPTTTPGKRVNFGCSGVDPTAQHIAPKQKTGAGSESGGQVYGDPDAASRYWQQQSQSDCGLMATRLAIGELTDSPPTEAQMIDLAKKTPSECTPGEPVYDDSFDPSDGGTGHGTCMTDLALLLSHYGIDSKYTNDSDVTIPTGLKALQGYLADGKQAIVCVNSATIWDSDGQRDHCGHVVTVAAIDTGDDAVYLGDSGGDDTAGETVSIETFEKAWAMGGHDILLAG